MKNENVSVIESTMKQALKEEIIISAKKKHMHCFLMNQYKSGQINFFLYLAKMFNKLPIEIELLPPADQFVNDTC